MSKIAEIKIHAYPIQRLLSVERSKFGNLEYVLLRMSIGDADAKLQPVTIDLPLPCIREVINALVLAIQTAGQDGSCGK